MTKKKLAGRGVLCAICLLLCAALLAACGAGAVDASGSDLSVQDASGTGAPLSGGADAPGALVPENASSGVPAGISADGKGICGLPLAPDSAPFPEDNRTAELKGGTVSLRMDAETYALTPDGLSEALGYTIENTTGHSVGVCLAPRLERWTEDGWEWVESAVGFCGTPDNIEETEFHDSLLPEWYPDLTEGVYRLTYTVEWDGGTVLRGEQPVSACFRLETDETQPSDK